MRPRLERYPGRQHKEDLFWTQTLTALASRFGVADPVIETKSVGVDRKRPWRNARTSGRTR